MPLAARFAIVLFALTGFAAVAYAMIFHMGFATGRLVLLMAAATLCAQTKVKLYKASTISLLTSVVLLTVTQEGLASFYGKEFDGRKTSNGEVFHKDDLTAAHRTYPFGTKLKVTNLKNGSQVEVRINDRGPVKPERIIDLSYGAAKVIGLDRMGLARVRLEVLDWGE